TYKEVLEMAQLGAKVIHPSAVELLENARIPIRILSTLKEGPGTLVAANLEGSPFRKKKVVTSVAVASPRSLVLLKNNQAATVFKIVAEEQVSVDLINVSPESISFTIDSHTEEKVQSVLPDAIITEGYAKVSVVGAGMRGVPGVMAQVVGALAKNNIEIIRTVDSHTSISCLVKEEDLKEATKALHDAFLLT
ncbi:MAG: ACT domain-containing protein, partial [Bacillota bacterium]